MPEEFGLSQNYPNPFNPSTTIDYTVEKEGFVDLLIYNTLGQKVRSLVSERKEAGTYSVRWYGRNDEGGKLPNGIYFYVLKTDDYTSSKKMILLK
jgi:flagellar hook assembly protein FlgD